MLRSLLVMIKQVKLDLGTGVELRLRQARLGWRSMHPRTVVRSVRISRTAVDRRHLVHHRRPPPAATAAKGLNEKRECGRESR